MNMRMLWIQSAAENTAGTNMLVANTLAGAYVGIRYDPSLTTGATRVFGYNGVPVSFTAWNTDEPNNAGGTEECVELKSSAKWNDISCNSKRAVLCENIPATSNANVTTYVPPSFVAITKSSTPVVARTSSCTTVTSTCPTLSSLSAFNINSSIINGFLGLSSDKLNFDPTGTLMLKSPIYTTSDALGSVIQSQTGYACNFMPLMPNGHYAAMGIVSGDKALCFAANVCVNTYAGTHMHARIGYLSPFCFCSHALIFIFIHLIHCAMCAVGLNNIIAVTIVIDGIEITVQMNGMAYSQTGELAMTSTTNMWNLAKVGGSHFSDYHDMASAHILLLWLFCFSWLR
jgi:hypothetical protein